MANPPPAWHPDPTGAHDHRWWDGERWTEHVADAGVASVDPLPTAPPGSTTAATSDTQTQTQVSSGDQAHHADGDDALRDEPSADTAGTRGMSADAASDPTAEETTALPPAARATAHPDTQRETPAAGAEWAYGGAETGRSSTPTSAPTGLAITALVLGVLSIPLAIIIVGGLLGLAAVICGAIASSRAKRGQGGGRGIAIGGIITGVTGVIVAAMTAVAVSMFSGEFVDCVRETGDQQLCQERLIEQLTREG